MPIIEDDIQGDTGLEDLSVDPTDVYKAMIAGYLESKNPGLERNKLILAAWEELDSVSPTPCEEFPNPLKPGEIIRRPKGINILEDNDLRE